MISRARINLRRKLVKHAAVTGQYPVAILSDCAVYAADSPSPLDFLPYRDGKTLPGGWKLGVNPGFVEWEGTQTVLWGEGVREEQGDDLNLARYIKDGNSTHTDDGEPGRTQQLRDIAAEGLQEVYFKERRRRADGLLAEFTNVEHIAFDL